MRLCRLESRMETRVHLYTPIRGPQKEQLSFFKRQFDNYKVFWRLIKNRHVAAPGVKPQACKRLLSARSNALYSLCSHQKEGRDK